MENFEEIQDQIEQNVSEVDMCITKPLSPGERWKVEGPICLSQEHQTTLTSWDSTWDGHWQGLSVDRMLWLDDQFHI